MAGSEPQSMDVASKRLSSLGGLTAGSVPDQHVANDMNSINAVNLIPGIPGASGISGISGIAGVPGSGASNGSGWGSPTIVETGSAIPVPVTRADAAKQIQIQRVRDSITEMSSLLNEIRIMRQRRSTNPDSIGGSVGSETVYQDAASTIGGNDSGKTSPVMAAVDESQQYTSAGSDPAVGAVGAIGAAGAIASQNTHHALPRRPDEPELIQQLGHPFIDSSGTAFEANQTHRSSSQPVSFDQLNSHHAYDADNSVKTDQTKARSLHSRSHSGPVPDHIPVPGSVADTGVPNSLNPANSINSAKQAKPASLRIRDVPNQHNPRMSQHSVEDTIIEDDLYDTDATEKRFSGLASRSHKIPSSRRGYANAHDLHDSKADTAPVPSDVNDRVNMNSHRHHKAIHREDARNFHHRSKRSFARESIESLLAKSNATYELDDIDLPFAERRLMEKFIDALSKLSIEVQMDESKRGEGRRRLNNALRALEGWI